MRINKNERNLEKLNEIFKDILSNPEVKINMDTQQEDLTDWDSMAMIAIISVLQEEYNVEIDLKDLDRFKSVRNIVNMMS